MVVGAWIWRAVWLAVILAQQQRGPRENGIPNQVPLEHMQKGGGRIPVACEQAYAVGYTTVWDRARVPQLTRYCDLLAHGFSNLEQRPQKAIEAAILADRLMPGTAAPWVLAGLGASAIQDPSYALKSFEKAQKRDPLSVLVPVVQVQMGKALQQANQPEKALICYQNAIARFASSTLPTDKSFALIAAASLSMYLLQASDSQVLKQKRLHQAISYLTEARRLPLTPYRDYGVALLILALHQAGQAQEADWIMTDMIATGADKPLLSEEVKNLSFLADRQTVISGPEGESRIESKQWDSVCELFRNGRKQHSGKTQKGREAKGSKVRQ